MISPLTRLFLSLVLTVLRLAPMGGAVTVSSFGRTARRNEAVGGVPDSLHLLMLAIDLQGPEVALDFIEQVWRAVGLDAVRYSTHLHLELDGPALR